MSVLLKFARHDPTLTLSQNGQTVTKTDANGDRLFRRAWQTGDPRFTDNGDGTVTDHKTGLVWLQNANAFGQQNWIDAEIAVAGLNNREHGLSDGSSEGQWRLPTKYELQKLCHDDNSAFQKPGAPFTAIQSGNYWSSSTNASNTAHGWCVSLGSGYVGWGSRTNNYYVWPVRGGQ